MKFRNIADSLVSFPTQSTSSPRRGFNSQLGPLTQSVALPTELRGTCLKSNPNFKFTSKKYTDQLQRHGEIKVCRLTFVVVIDYQPSQFVVSKFQSVS